MEYYRGTPDNPFHVSCGGVVYRKTDEDEIEVLLLHRFKTDNWEYDSWHLPKGTRRRGETEKEAATREILEETGWEVRPIKKLGSLPSTYRRDGATIQKTTHYFACEPIQQVSENVDEHDEVIWVPFDEAIEKLSHFKLWEREEKILNKLQALLEKL